MFKFRARHGEGLGLGFRVRVPGDSPNYDGSMEPQRGREGFRVRVKV